MKYLIILFLCLSQLTFSQDDLLAEIGKVIVGQKDMVERLVIGLLGNGHILLEGVPGLAKTLAINSLASAMDAKAAANNPPTTIEGTIFTSLKRRISVKLIAIQTDEIKAQISPNNVPSCALLDIIATIAIRITIIANHVLRITFSLIKTQLSNAANMGDVEIMTSVFAIEVF